MHKPITYNDAGVNIAAGDAFVEAIGTTVRATHAAEVLQLKGGFAGAFALDGLLAASGMKNPVLLSATDGVGSKIEVANALGRFDSIGQDLVAMSINDLLCHGAKPLFFLDYIAAAKLDPKQGAALVAGVADACCYCGCALLGGETAEMPSVYPAGKWDIAGFAVGIADKSALLPSTAITEGDRIFGIASNGMHANGFALMHRALERAGLSLDDALDGATIGEHMITPTPIYREALALQKTLENDTILGFAHITGGGLMSNLTRILPEGLSARLDVREVAVPTLMAHMVAAGIVDIAEAYRVWNMGVGFCVVVKASAIDAAHAAIKKAFAPFRVYDLGAVVAENEGALLRDGKPINISSR